MESKHLFCLEVKSFQAPQQPSLELSKKETTHDQQGKSSYRIVPDSLSS